MVMEINVKQVLRDGSSYVMLGYKHDAQVAKEFSLALFMGRGCISNLLVPCNPLSLHCTPIARAKSSSQEEVASRHGIKGNGQPS